MGVSVRGHDQHSHHVLGLLLHTEVAHVASQLDMVAGILNL